MHLKILLPYKVFTEQERVKRIVAETPQGSFGIFVNRLDCVAALSPGIFTFEVENETETYVAIDEGVLVKIGKEVFVSVRNAVGGLDLGKLQEAVKVEFNELNKREKKTRVVLAKLESGFLRRFTGFHHDKN